MIKAQDNQFHDSQTPLLIIPAAGFGRRVGSPLSKEMLKNSKGEALINYCLQQAADRKWPVHLITREEKTDLIQFVKEYCRQRDLVFQIQRIEASQEWPDTLLKSQKYWRDKNILCLPDTIFRPVNILDDLNISLNQGFDLAVAGFAPEEKQSWGYFRKISDSEIEICEKPLSDFQITAQTKAWGLVGFKSSVGKSLFEAQLASTFDHNWKAIKAKMLFSELASFSDVTRQAAGSLL